MEDVMENYNNFTVEELEKEYEALKKIFCFSSKEEQIKYILDNNIDFKKVKNVDELLMMLESLLVQKSEKAYKFEPIKFEISFRDIIDIAVNGEIDIFWAVTISNFFQMVYVDETDKINFFISLFQNKELFNEFTRDIVKADSEMEIYNKYKALISGTSYIKEESGLLKRKDIADFYHEKRKSVDANESSQVMDFINMLLDELNKYSYLSDDNFVFTGRKKFLYEEIELIFSGMQKEKNPIYFALGSLDEFICENNFVYASSSMESELSEKELREKNDNYINTGIICLEEKNYIVQIIKIIKDYIIMNA